MLMGANFTNPSGKRARPTGIARPGVGARPGHEGEALLQRSLLYVSSTRDRDEFVITWFGEPHELVAAALDEDED
ncbi:hypothetical protein [Pseudactinotalea sp. HY158]|uniref:hypothetical protein n=1 Tax=Pseudactinotalea sp. HY158 TaxID=2654547 RepID=UPI00129C724F|nr:hypothetical protein [Pseudactinotalea sp. HY158]QGH69696.1 hypothetical protein GCE65_09355 [Pseudactinotalea sp. HY158]